VIYVTHLEAQEWIGNFRKSYANRMNGRQELILKWLIISTFANTCVAEDREQWWAFMTAKSKEIFF